MKKLPKNSGFTTPDTYFKGVSEKVLGKGDIKTTIPKNAGFATPDGYFNTSNDSLIEKDATEEPTVIDIASYKKKYYRFVAAAAAIVIFTAIIFNVDTDNNLSFDDLANTDIENYFDETSMDLSTYDLALVLPIDELEIADIIDAKINEEEITNYLDANNNIDIQELYK